jgi:nitrile hydratase accessory protein
VNNPAATSPDEPVFDAPWQAEAFALTVALNEAGHLEWSEWAQYLSQALRDAGQSDESPLAIAHDSEGNEAYYQAWLVALERVVREKDWVGPLQLGARREAIRAYINVADNASTLRVNEND